MYGVVEVHGKTLKKQKNKTKNMKNKYLKQLGNFLNHAGSRGMDMLDDSHRALEYFSGILQPQSHELTAEFIDEHTLFDKYGGGFALAPNMFLSMHASYEGMYIGGGAGSGKTTYSCIPSILNANGSLIIHDCEKELFFITASALYEQGTGVGQIDFEFPECSHGFNPILRANTIGEIHKVASSLVRFVAKGKQDYFDNMSVTCITFLIQVVKQLPEQYQHLYQAGKLLELMQGKSGREKMNQLIAYLDEQELSLGLYATYESIMSNSPNTLSSILSSASTALSIFMLNDNVRRLTSHDTLGEFQQFRTKRLALFLHTGNSTVVNYYAPITNLLLDQLFSSLYSEMPSEEKESVFVILDETPVLYLTNLASLCATARKRRIGINIVCQEGLRQLSAKYGRDESHAIMSSMRTQVFYSLSSEEALALSREFGRFNYIDKERNNAQKTRDLITPDELLSLPQGLAIVKSRGQRPIKTRRLTPYYQDRKLKHIKSLPPVVGYPEIDYDLDPEIIDIDNFLSQQNKEENES